MKTLTKTAIATVGALLVVGSISACSHHHDPEHRAQWMQKKVTKKLDLNDSQQEKLQTVSTQMMTARNDMKHQFGNDREQLLALLEQPTLDQDKVLTIIQSHTQTMNDRAPVIVASVGDFYDSLSVEQQAEVRQFVQQHRGRGRHSAE